ncbi:hypothetical protein DPMN_114716 [Dreissena polymorpha]|uniref:Uncharacterized protein n=1 Tax=Dreissena polymorpha TaxID=45954 RepID=A0A9D4KL54_DREPO|nr:hypothetical protein DPMN_114716 [Dreissena polymorpha]
MNVFQHRSSLFAGFRVFIIIFKVATTSPAPLLPSLFRRCCANHYLSRPITSPLGDSSKFFDSANSAEEDVRLDELRYLLDSQGRFQKSSFKTEPLRTRQQTISIRADFF